MAHRLSFTSKNPQTYSFTGTMKNFYTALIFFIGFVSFSLFQDSAASVVSTGNFNKDFFVIWSPNHVNTSADGRTRSLKLDQESGTNSKL